MDLDGDGRADVLGSGIGDIVWRQFTGRDGWAASETSGGEAVATLQDRSGTVLLADMTGDGLADLVQVRPGSVRYWPSLGFGRFGTAIEMSGAPALDGPDGFDPARVRLADADGSGPADLLYLGRNGVSCWPNQAGNTSGDVVVRRYRPGWADVPELRPEADLLDPAERTMADELGRAVAVFAPDGTRSRVIRTAWRTERWDAVDWVTGSRWEQERLSPGAPPDELLAARAGLPARPDAVRKGSR